MRAAAGALALALTAACFFPLFAPPVSAEITESAAPGYGVGRIMPEAESAEEEPEEEKKAPSRDKKVTPKKLGKKSDDAE